MAYVQLVDSLTKQVKNFQLVLDTYVLGRHSMCGIVLSGGSISREHARITHAENVGYFIEDLNSRNGTLLNGKPLTTKTRLYDQDIILISDIAITFHSDDPNDIRKNTFIDNSQLNVTQQIKLVPEEDRLELESSSDISMGENSLDNSAYIHEIDRLRTRLRVMVSLGKDLSTLNNSEELVPKFLTSLLELYPNAGAVCMVSRNSESDQLVVLGHMRRNENDRSPYRISRSIIERAIQSRSGIRSDELGQNFQRFPLAEGTGSFMAVPIIDPKQDELIGVVQIEAHPGGAAFSGDDLELLVSVSSQIALYYESTRLQDLQTKEKIISNEMRIAHQVQQGFLPEDSPKLDDYDFFDHYRSAKEIGGDYFDYVMLPEDRLAIVVADVAGKGTSAALLVAKLSSDVRYSLLLEKNLPDAMARLNNCYTINTWGNLFVTFLLIVIDLKTSDVHIINAGHVLPVLSKTDGTIESLAEDVTTFPLGVMPNNTYQEYVFKIKEGEIVSMMSDGIPDAMNHLGNYFTSNRVNEYLRNPGKLSTQELGERLIKQVQEFVGTTQQSDDQCLVIFGRIPQNHVEFVD